MNQLPPTIAVRFDMSIAATIGIGLLAAARGDNFETMQRDYKDGHTINDQINYLLTKDEQGKKLLTPVGSGYIGVTIVMALQHVFSMIPNHLRPKDKEGVEIGPLSMAWSALQSGSHYIEQQLTAQEGPKREVTDGTDVD